MPASGDKCILACGVLGKEIDHLIAKNGWPLQGCYLGTALHVSFERLEKALTSSLRRLEGRTATVAYGACHPRMDELLQEHGVARTPGQNCIELVLGRERFAEELEGGAFFLLEGWVCDWAQVSELAFGDRQGAVMRQIFQEAHSYLLAITTPVSTDFSAAAQQIAEQVGLPLRWTAADLAPLEQALREGLAASAEAHEQGPRR